MTSQNPPLQSEEVSTPQASIKNISEIDPSHFDVGDVGIGNIAKAIKRISPDSSRSDKQKLDELNDKVNNLGFDKEEGGYESPFSKKKIKKVKTFHVGALSNLNQLSFEETSPSIKLADRGTPTPSGIDECRKTIMKILDESVSGRNYPLKPLQASNSSKNSNAAVKQGGEPNFSFFLKQNMLVNYYDASPRIGEQTPGLDPSKLTKPTEFLSIINDGGDTTSHGMSDANQFNASHFDNNDSNFYGDHTNNSNMNMIDYTNTSNANTNANSYMNNNSINNNENTNNNNNGHNMYLNMNVNMKVVNPPPSYYNAMNNNLNIGKKDMNNNQMNQKRGSLNGQRFKKQQGNNLQNQLQANQNTFSNFSQNYMSNMGGIANMNNINTNNFSVPNSYFYNQQQSNAHDYYFSSQNDNFNQGNGGNMYNNNSFNNYYMKNSQGNYFGNQNNFGMMRYGNNGMSMEQQMQMQGQNQGQGQNQNQLMKRKQKPQTQLNFYNMSISDLIKNSNALSKDQSGCRFLQKKIEEQPEIASKILNNALQNVIEIITDSFGNYLIQKLFDYMTSEQFCQFLALIQIDIYKICINSYGTRVIQRIIDFLNTELLMKTFIGLIKPIVKNIILDINGSHILLKLIDLNNPLSSKVIYNEINENIVMISMHKHGCCVLQKCIEKADAQTRAETFDILLKHCKELINDQCGNYIIQFVISLNIEENNKNICDQLCEDIRNFSKQKYSSNVVEKCFECCSDQICSKLIKALEESNCIVELLFDKFGNYVVQKALNRADEQTQQNLLNVIAPHLKKLKNFPFGLKLYSKLIITYSYLSMIILGRVEDGPNEEGMPMQNAQGTGMNQINMMNAQMNAMNLSSTSSNDPNMGSNIKQ